LADRKQLKRRLGWLEFGLYLAGVVMIVIFVTTRVHAKRLQEEGLQAFEQTIDRQDLPGTLPGEQPEHYTSPRPGQELWAQKRIREYEESLKVGGDPPLAVLSIDSLGIRVPVYNGADDHNLNRGVGRIKGTAWIGTEGNLGIAGHRDGFFRPLKDIVAGDSMELQTANGIISYEVSSIEIVNPDDVSVLFPTAGRSITLVTCYPFYYVGHAPERFIVKAIAEHNLAETNAERE
jgi:sortase A